MDVYNDKGAHFLPGPEGNEFGFAEVDDFCGKRSVLVTNENYGRTHSCPYKLDPWRKKGRW